MHKKMVALALSISLVTGTGIVSASGASTNSKVAAAKGAVKIMAARVAAAKAARSAFETLVNAYTSCSVAETRVTNMYKAIASSPVAIAVDTTNSVYIAAQIANSTAYVAAQGNKTDPVLAAQAFAAYNASVAASGVFFAAAHDFNALIGGATTANADVDRAALANGGAIVTEARAVCADLSTANISANATEDAFMKAVNGSINSAAAAKAWVIVNRLMQVLVETTIPTKTAETKAAITTAQQTVAAQHSVAVVGLANLYAAWAVDAAITHGLSADSTQSWVAYYDAAIKALAAKTPVAADAAWNAYSSVWALKL